MFRIVIKNERLYGGIVIEGCPKNGIPAIDFRRKHGFPDAPTNQIQLPEFRFTDEEFVRKHEDKANGEADIVTIRQTEYQRTEDNQIISLVRHLGLYSEISVRPAPLVAYLKEQNPQTAKALLEDIWGYGERSRARVTVSLYNLASKEGQEMALEEVYKGDNEAFAYALAFLDAESEGLSI